MPTARDPNRAALMHLAPELALLAAVLQQALHDVRSRRADVRQEAQQFLQDEAALGWWAAVLGIDGGALHQHAQELLRRGR